jgi:integrase
MTRPYGDGSVFWDERRRRWVGIFTSGRDASGKRLRHKVLARSKTEARAKLRALQHQAADGRPLPNAAIRVGPFLDRWLTEVVEAKGSSPNTVDNYRWAVDHHIKPALGTTRLRDLTPDDVDGLLRAKNDAGLAHSSLMRIRAVLIQALRHGERYGYVSRNVAQLVDLPRAPRREGRSLTVEQAKDLLAAAKGERLEAAVICGLMLGLRPGELLGLSWADVDMKGRCLTVRRSLKREGRTLRLGDPKTPRSLRTLTMPPTVLEAFRAHRARQAQERLAAGPLWSDSGLVFASEVGTPLDPSNLRRSFARITHRAGLGKWHPHELRHSAASLLSHSGVSIEEVADLLGHTDVRMTSSTYRHRITRAIGAAAAPMEELFGDR